jgi:uncharacterized membrane protein
MIDWAIAIPAFLTASVEWVEAFTIVLAVSLSIGWAAATGAAVAALATLGIMTVATGSILHLGFNITWIQLGTGVFLLLFGTRWMAKAIARQAGLTATHDEAVEFAETREVLARGDWHAAWLIAFKGVLLEGLEVWLIVSALGLKGSMWLSSAGAAIAALAVVAVTGLLVRVPLQLVPENAIKFVVGTMILAFGTFWTMEALGGTDVWPISDWTLLVLVAFYFCGGLVLSLLLRGQAKPGLAS